MNFIYYLNIFTKYCFINLITFYTNFKISNIKPDNHKPKITIFFVSVTLASFLTFLSNFFKPSYVIIIPFLALTFAFYYISKSKFDYSLIITLVSMAITLSLYVFTTFIILFVWVYLFHLPKENPLILVISILLESLAIFNFFRIKRFKNGFSFFKRKKQPYEFIFSISLIVILICTIYGKYINKFISQFYFANLILILICIFFWIKEKITLHYKNQLAKDTIDNLQTKLDEQININQSLQDEIDKVSTVNHKFSSRISALEMYVSKLSTTNNSKLKTSGNPSVAEAQKLIQSMSCEFSEEMLANINNKASINRTGIINIDTILDYFNTECDNKNIAFDVIVKSNIESAINNLIPLNLLETLLSDMIKNAIIAISYSSNTKPKILVQFDIVSNNLEIRIYDTGIEFEIDTLAKFGKEKITTHKNDGGSGIGIYTTFQTLDKTKGSFIIEEYNSTESGFVKCLIFKFDGRNKYVIRSYRYDEIINAINIDSSNFVFEQIAENIITN